MFLKKKQVLHNEPNPRELKTVREYTEKELELSFKHKI